MFSRQHCNILPLLSGRPWERGKRRLRFAAYIIPILTKKKERRGISIWVLVVVRKTSVGNDLLTLGACLCIADSSWILEVQARPNVCTLLRVALEVGTFVEGIAEDLSNGSPHALRRHGPILTALPRFVLTRFQVRL